MTGFPRLNGHGGREVYGAEIIKGEGGNEKKKHRNSRNQFG